MCCHAFLAHSLTLTNTYVSLSPFVSQSVDTIPDNAERSKFTSTFIIFANSQLDSVILMGFTVF